MEEKQLQDHIAKSHSVNPPMWVSAHPYKYKSIFVSIILPMLIINRINPPLWISTRPLELIWPVKCQCYNLDVMPNYIPHRANAFAIAFAIERFFKGLFKDPPPPHTHTHRKKTSKTTLMKNALSSIAVNKTVPVLFQTEEAGTTLPMWTVWRHLRQQVFTHR